MDNKKNPFYKTNGFRLFITVWIVYIFYLQMFGFSGMSNTQSALTAAIVNEGRFEVDTYHKAGGDGNAFYNGHYYSGQAPGISFVSVPLYFIGKYAFNLVPDIIINNLFDKLEAYGSYLPKDWKGEKKVLSNFFIGLSKREILEYVFISGFILPVFTTALITALSIVLLYSLLKHFTSNTRLRMLISLLYAFGTLLFPLSTEFFERPVAIALIFASFYILFKVKHVLSTPNKNTLFLAGFLAGSSVTFDYFNIILVGLLSLYLLHYLVNEKKSFNKISPLLYFSIGISIPLLLLGLYQYSIFDSPFTTSYTYRDNPDSNSINLSKLSNIILPDLEIIFNMAIFFIYSPIIIFAMYGLYTALKRKSRYFDEAVLILLAIMAIFAFSTVVVLSLQVNHPFAQLSFKRYLTPMLPFLFIFIPYSFSKQNFKKNSNMKIVFFALGSISLFLNWLSAQFGGHGALGHFNLNTMRFVYIERFLETGPSSSFLSALSNVFGLDSLIINLVGLAILLLIIYIIWKPNRKTLISSKTS